MVLPKAVMATPIIGAARRPTIAICESSFHINVNMTPRLISEVINGSATFTVNSRTQPQSTTTRWTRSPAGRRPWKRSDKRCRCSNKSAPSA